MIKVIFVENNEIKMSKEEFERLLEETYRRGKDENYRAAYNEGYKDGYCHNHWCGGLIGTTTTSTDGPTITYLNSTGEHSTYPNTWRDNITYCSDIRSDGTHDSVYMSKPMED